MPLLFLLLALISFSASAQLAITDGDTIKFNGERIRLHCIDAPERKQPHGIESRAALAAMVNENVTIRRYGVDRYGRTIGRLFMGDTDITAALVINGDAWVYRQFCHDETLLLLEQYARDSQYGLWLNPIAIEPSKWRRMRRRHN